MLFRYDVLCKRTGILEEGTAYLPAVFFRAVMKRRYDIAVCWIYAPARMEIGILQIYDLLCRSKFVPIRVDLPVAEKKRHYPFFCSVMAKL